MRKKPANNISERFPIDRFPLLPALEPSGDGEADSTITELPDIGGHPPAPLNTIQTADVSLTLVPYVGSVFGKPSTRTCQGRKTAREGGKVPRASPPGRAGTRRKNWL
jgi:hypothetical protein